MTMRLLPRILATSGLLALTVGGSTIGASVASAHPDVVGHLYVDDNTAGTNTIAAFDRHADGSLTAVPGSPFAAGGAGTGLGIGSQGALQMSSDGRYLLAVDAGSNQISVLRIGRDGDLREVEDTPVSSRGVEPVSIAVHPIDTRRGGDDHAKDLVYVANAGNGDSNYTGFTLDGGGRLRHLLDSTVSLPDGSQPGDVLFSGDGSRLVGTRVGTSVIDSFTVGRHGHLTAAAGSPFPAQGVGPFGSEFRPTNSAQLFVSNAHGGTNNGTVSAFRDARDGTLTSIGSSPFADLQTAPCWVEISRDGKFLFTVNTAVPSISRYQIAANGSLTLLGSTPFKHPAGLGPEDARLAPGGNTLWVVDTAADALSAFAVNGSNLTELPSSPTALPAGSAPFGIVFD
jgi:6-phosphogluconolactonase (cycloisomerase 2 family)